jgi:hypothetical protein
MIIQHFQGSVTITAPKTVLDARSLEDTCASSKNLRADTSLGYSVRQGTNTAFAPSLNIAA